MIMDRFRFEQDIRSRQGRGRTRDVRTASNGRTDQVEGMEVGNLRGCIDLAGDLQDLRTDRRFLQESWIKAENRNRKSASSTFTAEKCRDGERDAPQGVRSCGSGFMFERRDLSVYQVLATATQIGYVSSRR